MRKSNAITRALFWVGLIHSACAQEPETVFRAASRLVQVNVIAQDKNGAAVRDLTRDDFIVSDNKQPQSMAVFSNESAESNGGGPIHSLPNDALTIANRTLATGETPIPEWTLAALEDIAGHLAGIPGRKNLIWISSAFPISIGFSGANQDITTYSVRE